MVTGKRKYRILVACSGDKVFEYIEGILPAGDYESIRRVRDAGEARRILSQQTADVVIINTPLPDEYGVELAQDLAEGTTGVLLLVKSEVYADICYKVEDLGIACLSKPMSGQSFLTAVKLLTAVSARLSIMERKNQSLTDKMQDIRTINRAKWLLIERLHMTEQDAHYYIEKQAMDTRLSRREIAQNIIRTYSD